MNREKLKALYLKYELTSEDIFTKDIGFGDNKKTFTIITRSGIEKIQAKENIKVAYKLEVVNVRLILQYLKQLHSLDLKPILYLRNFW